MVEVAFVVSGVLGLLWVLHGGRPVVERAGAWVPGRCDWCQRLWPVHKRGCPRDE